MEALLDRLFESFAEYGPTLVAAALILLIGWLGSRALAALTRRLLNRMAVDATLVAFLSTLVYVTALLLVGIAVLGKLGVNTTAFAAVLAAAGLAIGFALQGSLANFAAGIMLIGFRPFRSGDYVEAAGVGGTVEVIQLFATVLRTPDNKQIVVPNGAITSGNIVNYSAKEQRRIDLVFGIGYGDDLPRAKALLERIVTSDERILKDPAPTVGVTELGDSSVNFAVRPWVKTGDYWDVYFDLNERVKTEFDREGISIPFPQTDVHVHRAA